MIRFTFILFLVLFSSEEIMAENTDATSLPAKQEITPDNVNLSAEDFLAAYTSSNKNEKEKAMFYLLGVLDETEGKIWCNYEKFKSISLREWIFQYFKDLPKNKSKKRASIIIEEALRRYFPSCAGGK